MIKKRRPVTPEEMARNRLRKQKEAVRQRPKAAEPRIILATSNLFLGKYKKAIRLLKEAVELDPKNAEAYSWLGDAYKFSGHPREAFNCYTTALELNPKSRGLRADIEHNIKMLRKKIVKRRPRRA